MKVAIDRAPKITTSASSRRAARCRATSTRHAAAVPRVKQWVDLRAGPESAEGHPGPDQRVYAGRPHTGRSPTTRTNARTAAWRRSRRSTRGSSSGVRRRSSGCGEAAAGPVPRSRRASPASASPRWSGRVCCRAAGGRLPGSDCGASLLLRPGADPRPRWRPRCSPAAHGGDQATVDQLADRRADPHLAAHAGAGRRAAGCKLLVVVDQFEEIFTLCREGRAAGVRRQSALRGGGPARPAVVVLVLRADFYPRLAQYPELAQLVQSHHMLVGPHGRRTSCAQVIEEPARGRARASSRASPTRSSTTSSGEPGNLPLLEHALLETWRHRHGRMLTLAGYRETGGVRRGLGERADAVYDALSDSGKVEARNLFLRLIQPGEGTEDTRRRRAVRSHDRRGEPSRTWSGGSSMRGC